MLVTCSSTFLPQRRMFLSEMVEEEEDLPPNQLLDHTDKPENRADAVTIEELNDKDVQQIHISAHTASVQVRCYSTVQAGMYIVSLVPRYIFLA